MSDLTSRAYLLILTGLFIALTACSTSEQQKIPISPSVKSHNYREYFYNYENFVKAIIKQKKYTSKEVYILGEYYFLRGELKQAERYLLAAMESQDDPVVDASLALFQELFASHSLARGMAYIKPQTTDPLLLSSILTDSAAWALALGDSEQAQKQLHPLHPLQQFYFHAESYLHTSSDITSYSAIEKHYLEKKKDVDYGVAINIGQQTAGITLSNYVSFKPNDIYYLYSEFTISSETVRSLVVKTKMNYRLYIDGKVIIENLKNSKESLATPYSFTPGKHTVLLKITSQHDNNSDISLFFIEGKPALQKQYATTFDTYLRLIGDSETDNSYTSLSSFYSTVIGSDAPHLLWRLAKNAQKQEQIFTAEKLLNRALSTYPTMDYLRSRFIDILLDNRAYNSAAQALKKMHNKAGFIAITTHAEFVRKKGWITTYKELVTTIRKKFPDFIITNLYASDTLIEHGDILKALQLKKDILHTYPGYQPIAKQLLQHYKECGNNQEALNVLSTLLSLYPLSRPYLMTRAQAFFALSRYREAQLDYETVLSLDPHYLEAHIKAGDCALAQKKRKEALAHYMAARNLAPDLLRVSHKIEYFDAKEPPRHLAHYLLSDEDVAQLEQNFPSSYCEEDVQVLLDEGVQYFSETSSYHALYRVILRVITEKGARQLSYIPISDSLKSVEIIKKDGTISDSWTMGVSALSISNLSIGDKITYLVENHDFPESWIEGVGFEWFFGQQGRCVEKSIFTILYPENLTLSTHTHGGVKKIKDSLTKGIKEITFEAEQTVITREQSFKTSFRDFVPLLAISTVPSWDIIAEWYLSLIHNTATPSDSIIKKADALHRDDTTALFIRRAFHFVRNEIRQKGSNYGLWSSPASPRIILRQKSGTYNDKLSLFRSLLHSQGVSSFFLLTQHRKDGSIFTDMPIAQFTHTLLWIPPQDGVKKGIYITFDKNIQEMGVVDTNITGQQGFLLDDKEGEYRFVTIP